MVLKILSLGTEATYDGIMGSKLSQFETNGKLDNQAICKDEVQLGLRFEQENSLLYSSKFMREGDISSHANSSNVTSRL